MLLASVQFRPCSGPLWHVYKARTSHGFTFQLGKHISRPPCVNIAVASTKQRVITNKQRFLTPGHQGWNDLHSLCRIGMEYYLLNNDDNNIIYWIMMIIMIMMMIIIMIIMMTMMIIGTATIMIMIIIITTTLTMTIMKMIMIKTAQTPCQSLYKDRRI